MICCFTVSISVLPYESTVGNKYCTEVLSYFLPYVLCSQLATVCSCVRTTKVLSYFVALYFRTFVQYDTFVHYSCGTKYGSTSGNTFVPSKVLSYFRTFVLSQLATNLNAKTRVSTQLPSQLPTVQFLQYVVRKYFRKYFRTKVLLL